MKAIITALAIMAAIPAQAQTNAVTFIRSISNAGGVEVQFVGGQNGPLTCVVLNAEGKPVATGTTLAQLGFVMVYDLPLDQAANLYCRYVN